MLYLALQKYENKIRSSLFSSIFPKKKGANVKNFYTEYEIILCCYISRFGRNLFKEEDIAKINNRSLSSIKMKVQNIASMLDEEGAKTSHEVSKLTGLPAGQTGRRTNWDVVKRYANMPQEEHRKKCIEILSHNKK